MSVALLDVNVLLALLDSDHVDHVRAQEWAEVNLAAGWASCTLTENGFVRIISTPRYPHAISTSAAIELLVAAATTDLHTRWPSEVSLLDASVVDRSRLHGPGQVTDAYLLALAVHHGGRLVTFDRRISLGAVRGAGEEHLVLV